MQQHTHYTSPYVHRPSYLGPKEKLSSIDQHCVHMHSHTCVTMDPSLSPTHTHLRSDLQTRTLRPCRRHNYLRTVVCSRLMGLCPDAEMNVWTGREDVCTALTQAHAWRPGPREVSLVRVSFPLPTGGSAWKAADRGGGVWALWVQEAPSPLLISRSSGRAHQTVSRAVCGRS